MAKEYLTDGEGNWRLAGLNREQIWGTAMTGLELPEGITPLQKFHILCAALGITTPDSLHQYYAEKTVKDDNESDYVDWMTERLAKVCRITQYVWELTEAKNPTLHKQLTASVPRIDDGRELGRHEPENVPESNKKFISPTGTPTGWAFARLLILSKGQIEESKRSDILEAAIVDSINPVEFLCNISEAMYKEGIPADKIMSLILKDQILLDQSNIEMYFEVIDGLKDLNGGQSELWKEATTYYGDCVLSAKVPGWVEIIDEYIIDGGSIE